MDAHCGPALWGSCRAGLRAPPDAVCSLLFLCSYCCTVTSLTANDAPRCGVSLSWTVETLAAVSLFRGWCFSFVSNLFATSLVNSLCPWESFVGFHVLMRAEKNVWCLLSSIQYFDHLMQRADSFEKTLTLGKIEGRRRRGRQRMRWLDGITTQ